MADRRRLVRLGTAAPPLGASPVNLITNPSFEVDLAGWISTVTFYLTGAPTLTRDTSQFVSGIASAKVATPGVASAEGIGVQSIPVTIGQTYTFSVWLKGNAGGEQGIIRLGGEGGPNFSGTAFTLTTSWQRVSVTWTADEATASVVVRRTGTGTAYTFFVDAAQLELGSTATTYFDGDTAGYAWSGTAHASTSAPLAVTVKDLEDSAAYMSVRGSFQVIPPGRQQVLARRQRRYGGGRVVHETHDNGAITWKALVAGATVDAAILNAETMLTELERARTDLFFEWRPDGATDSVYYEIRGPADWKPTYEWSQMLGAKSWYFDVTIPVAPLAQLSAITIRPSALDLPAVIALGTAIPGDAPAIADVKLRTNGDTYAPQFALIGWTRRPGTPLASSVAPFGIIQAETAVSLSTWASVADANYHSGNGIRVNTSGAGTASASWVLDPSTVDPDDFAMGEVDIEVWARIQLDGQVVSPKLTLSLEPNAGTSFGQVQYSAEYGSTGKRLVQPDPGASGVFRFTRLGILSMPVNPAAPLKWNMKIAGAWSTGSAGYFGLDYLNLALARCRALSPTGKPLDATYPKFISSTSDTAKTIRGADLSGLVASGAGNAGRDSGLGGSPIELPPGNVDMLLKLSSLVPDSPDSDLSSEVPIKHASVVPAITVTPRVWLAKGA